jgi:hypothetical protein
MADPGEGGVAETALVGLARLHDEIDARCAPLGMRHASRLRCSRGCSSCCVDGLTVLAIEAERIRRAHAALLRDGAPHPTGACAFLDGGGLCRVYGTRPYVCRTQGLPLRWLEPDGEGGGVELRDICPLNDAADRPLERLGEEDCWTIGPFEQELVRLQQEFGGGSMTRVALRELFSRNEGS